jgi:hypothetical protein
MSANRCGLVAVAVQYVDLGIFWCMVVPISCVQVW